MNKHSARDKLSPRQILFSIIAAAFGVQSRERLKRDFSTGRPTQFIFAGILFTVFFVVAIVVLVDWIV
jgi:Protein of unknown function (DUF2970)